MTDHKWYILKVVSGNERGVTKKIHTISESFPEQISEIFAPKEEYTEIINGKKYTKERSILSGYVFIKMISSINLVNEINQTNKTSGFLGGNTPYPISQKELDKFIAQKNNIANLPKFLLGDMVIVCDGPFLSLRGKVTEIDEEKSILKVNLNILGRETIIDLSSTQVKQEDLENIY